MEGDPASSDEWLMTFRRKVLSLFERAKSTNKATRSFDTLGTTHSTTQGHITEDRTSICSLHIKKPRANYVFHTTVLTFNPLAYTDVPETAGLARSINP